MFAMRKNALLALIFHLHPAKFASLVNQNVKNVALLIHAMNVVTLMFFKAQYANQNANHTSILIQREFAEAAIIKIA